MEKVLFAADELTGLIWAAALMRPSKSTKDMELKSLKKKYKAKVASRQGRSVAYEVAEQLQELIPNEIRVALAGHIQRGGNPCGYDRFMATRFGVYGANLLLNKDFGKLVVFDKNEIKAIPLSETAGKLKFVDPECEVVSSAKKMGITFGE